MLNASSIIFIKKFVLVLVFKKNLPTIVMDIFVNKVLKIDFCERF